LSSEPALMTPGAAAAAALPPTIIGHVTAPITAPVTAHRTTGTAVLIVREVCAAAGADRLGVPISATEAMRTAANARDLMDISPDCQEVMIVTTFSDDNQIHGGTHHDDTPAKILAGRRSACDHRDKRWRRGGNNL
jgi:hypothetical protein